MKHIKLFENFLNEDYAYDRYGTLIRDMWDKKKGDHVKVTCFSSMHDDWPRSDYQIYDEEGNEIGKFTWIPVDSGKQPPSIEDFVYFKKQDKPEVWWHDFKGYK